MSATKITLADLDAKIGTRNLFLDIILGRNDVLEKKASAAKIISEHGSVSAYIKHLFQFRQVNELYVDVFKPNGKTHLVESRLVVTNDSASIKGTEQVTETSNNKVNNMGNNDLKIPSGDASAAFHALQNQMLTNSYNTLLSDYARLKEKFENADQELREAKTKISIAEAQKNMEVLQGKNEASGTLGGIMKDATRPENLKAFAELLGAIKGTAKGGSDLDIYKAMTQPQKDAINAMADIVKGQTDEENNAMLEICIRKISEKEGGMDFFQKLVQLQQQSGQA